MKKTLILTTALMALLAAARAQNVHYGEYFELNSTLNSSQSHEYTASDYIDLNPGFESNPNSSNRTLLQNNPFLNISPPYGHDIWFSSDHPINAGSGKVGSIPMEFEVNEFGAATISIPLEFPEGINGMTPHLSLNYNSQNGDGIMGLGWSLGGLSKISRVPYTYMYNDSCGAVQFSNQDEWSLDGNRLRKGTDGNYYPEVYDYSVVSSTNDGFIIHKKDGVVCEYKVPYYLQSGTGSLQKPIEWHISKMQDTYGNTIEFHYRNERSNGSFFPDTIQYTGHQGFTPVYTLVFSYNERQDTPRKYFSSKDASNVYNSGYSRVSKTLSSITCYHSGNKLIEYVLSYSDMGIWNDKGLKRVQKYSYDVSRAVGEMVSSTIFEWDGTMPFLQYEEAGDTLEFSVNDYLYTWQQFSLFPARFENSISGMISEKHTSDIVHLQKAGEGVSPNYILSIYRNMGSFLQPTGQWRYYYESYDCSAVNTALSDGREIFAFMPADTDGDGLNEIACVYGNRNNNTVQSLNVCLIRKTQNLSSFYIEPISIQTNQPDKFGDFAIMDFDGDGRSDLFCTCDNNMIVYPSTEGHPFNEGCKITCEGTTPYLSTNRNIVIGDFYGNKKDQILVMNKNGDQTIRTKIYFGCHREQQNGPGQFLPADPVDADMATYFFNMNENVRNLHFNWGDFNGDGKKDALVMLNDRWLLYFSKGNGQFTDPVTYSNNSIVNDSFINTISPVFQPMAHVADFDQDGCDDLSVSHFRFYRYFGPNYENLVYAGICRRDFLIKLKNNQIDVKKISILDGDGNDIVIDSLKWNTFDAFDTLPTNPGYPYYYQKPYLSCVGMYKGTSPSEILYSRLTENRGLILHVTGSLDSHPKNVVGKIIDGLGATTEIYYRPQTYQIPYLNSMNGLPDGERNNFEKIIPYHGFLNVVQRVRYEMKDAENGSGKTYRETKHHFSEAQYHTQGKGFVGFRKTWRRIQGENNTKDLQTTNIYHVDPNRGMLFPRSNINTHFNSNGVLVVHDSTNYQYTIAETFPSALGSIPTSISGGVFAPYLSSSLTIRNNGSPQKYEKNITAKDNYGNVTSFERKYGNSATNLPYYEKTVTTYDNSVTATRRILGVPKTETMTQRLVGATSDKVVRHTNYQNDMTHGRHQNKVTEQNTVKQLTETYGYDSFGNLDSITRDIGNGSPRIETFGYSADGRFMTAQTNAKGHVTHYYYHDATGLLDSVTDPNGLTTKYYYDYLCNLVKTEFPSGIQKEQVMKWIDNNPQSTTYHPDTPDFGAPVYFTWSKRSGESEQYTFYDQHRRKLREVSETMDGKKVYVDYRYHDVTGLLDSVSAPYYPGEHETPQFTTYQYDYLERNTGITRPDGAFVSHVFNGTQETIQGFDGQKRKLTYNAAGQVTKVSDYGNANSSPVVIDYVRYGDGQVKTSKVGEDNATTITYTYDANRNPTMVSDPSLGQLTYDYNGFGELVYSATPRDTVSYTYDVLGRMVTRNGLDGSSQWSYDQSFKGVLSQTNYFPAAGDAVTENYRYDDLGRLVWQRQRLGSQEDWEFEYGYDVLGHRNSVTYPSGKKFKWHYDRNGFMDRVTDASSNAVVWSATATDRWGNTTEFTEGNIGVAYGYDPVSGLVTGISARKNGQPLFGQACSWTSVGNLEWRTDTTLNLRETFDYDRFNRLETAYTKNLVGTTTYSSNSFGFDNNGNITQKDGVGSYTYDDAGPYALTELSPLAGTESLYEDQIATYTPFDKLRSVIQNVDTLSVNYGIDRQRVTQTFDDGATRCSKRYFTPLYETVTENGVTKKLHYLTAATGLFAIFVSTSSEGGTMYYTLKDHQGSLAAVVHGSTVERLSYDPWGRRRNTTNFGYDNVNHTFDRGYTLHEHYDEFDLINMNGRLYDPILGRMLSPDVVIQDEQSSQAYNRYSYCFNNPLRFTDPSGYVVRGSSSLFDGFTLFFYESPHNKGVLFNTDEALGQQLPKIEPFGEEEKKAYIAYRNMVFSYDTKEFKTIQTELIRLENAEEVFRIRMGKNTTSKAGGGNFIYNKETGEFDVNIADYGDFSTMGKIAHELKHADQYMEGKIGFDLRGGVVNNFAYDFCDEVEAFERQGMFGNTLTRDEIKRDYYDLWKEGDFKINKTIYDCAHDNPARPFFLMKKANSDSYKYYKTPIYLYHGWKKDIQ